MSSFSHRQGYVRPKEIQFTEELPERLRIPIYDILRNNLNSKFLRERAEKLFNPYGIDSLPAHSGSILVAKEEDNPDTIGFKRLVIDWRFQPRFSGRWVLSAITRDKKDMFCILLEFEEPK